jgi:predicted phosphate transport protein (TIGR00153 family)
MKLENIIKLFLPKDGSFFPLFESAVKNLTQASNHLKELMIADDIELQHAIIKQIKDFEKEGDRITDETFYQLNKTFITPFDREDIHELAADIDDVLDAINGISSRINFYRPVRLFPVYSEMSEIIFQATKEIEVCVNHLRDASSNKNLIMSGCDRIASLEQKADEVYYTGISGFFQNEKNVTELVKSKDILEILEKCMDETDAVAETLKTILVKLA